MRVSLKWRLLLCCEVDCAGVLVERLHPRRRAHSEQGKDLIAQSHRATVVRTHKRVKPLRVVCSWGANQQESEP